MQDDIAKLIATQLKISLGIEEVISERGTNIIEAYENVLKGRHLHNKILYRSNLSLDMQKSLFYDIEKLFIKAIEIDSNYADAHAELANLYDAGIDIFVHDSTLKSKSHFEIEIAYRLNPNSGIVNFVKGAIYSRNNELEKAQELYVKALEIDPQNLTMGYDFLASELMLYGMYDEARLLFIKYLEYDPINTLILRRKGYDNQLMGRFDAAEKDFKETLLLGDNSSNYLLTRLYCLKKDLINADLYFDKFLQSDAYNIDQEKTLNAYLLAAKGDQKALDFLRSQEILLMLGNYDEWFDYMGAFFEKNPIRCYYHQLTVDPINTEGVHQEYLNLFYPLRKHPRYSAMLESQKKRYEDNVRRFSLKNSILKDM
jgi:tetratricopeptide (TPR) repeat protein